jgi:ABC-type anion transport system duplicated permease subunit
MADLHHAAATIVTLPIGTQQIGMLDAGEMQHFVTNVNTVRPSSNDMSFFLHISVQASQLVSISGTHTHTHSLSHIHDYSSTSKVQQVDSIVMAVVALMVGVLVCQLASFRATITDMVSQKELHHCKHQGRDSVGSGTSVSRRQLVQHGRSHNGQHTVLYHSVQFIKYAVCERVITSASHMQC